VKRQCEGYCGGMVKITSLVEVGPEGERMCGECAEKWLVAQLEARKA